MSKQYETVIGLEVHVELSTKTKIFCGCSTEFGGAPNTHICPVCSGLPGALPVLNRQVVEDALALGAATHCHVNRLCRFDRKNYFYPDNPQNYQISSSIFLSVTTDGWIFPPAGEPGGFASMRCIWKKTRASWFTMSGRTVPLWILTGAACHSSRLCLSRI